MQDARTSNIIGNPMEAFDRKDSRKKAERRHFTLKTVLKSISLSRRKTHRRHDESPDAQRDWYHPRLFVLVIGIVLMSVADAFFTLQLISRGAIEANPVMDYFLSISVPVFVSAKMLLTCCSIVLLTALSSYLFLNRILMSHFITISFIGYIVLVSYELLLLSVI